MVLFLSRDLEQTSPRSQDATVSVAKHRNGRTGDCEMSYIPSCMQFANKEKGFVPASQVPLSVALPRTSLPKTYDIDDILPD